MMMMMMRKRKRMGSFCIASEALTRKKSRMSERVKERGTIPSLLLRDNFIPENASENMTN